MTTPEEGTPYALRVTFIKIFSPTMLAYLNTKEGRRAEVREQWVKTFMEEAQKMALDYVSQWIDDGSVVPTVAVIDAEGNALTNDLERVHKLSRPLSTNNNDNRRVVFLDNTGSEEIEGEINTRGE